MIAVIDFGMGNLHSCLKAISKFTSNYELIQTPDRLEGAKGIILPGDGAFESAMQNLTSMGFIEPIKKAVEQGVFLFGICIGFQLLFENSNEDLMGKDRVFSGLGLVKGKVRKFSGKHYTVPHMGWNKIYSQSNKFKLLKGISKGEYMYFIHSYRPIDVERTASAAVCEYYDEKFTAVVEKNTVFGTQFHPEKSDMEGLKILKNFIEIVES